MDVIRRNTDYSMRAVVHMAKHFGAEPVSNKCLAEELDIPYHLVCKLMQMLCKAGFVKSCMGPKGGFFLARDPAEISLLEVIEAIQGRIVLNRCLLGANRCPKQAVCTIRGRLAELQDDIDGYLRGVTIKALSEARAGKRLSGKEASGRRRR